MIKFFLAVLTLCMIVTCFNVQALRDTYAPEPDAIETIIVNALTKEVNNGIRTADQS